MSTASATEENLESSSNEVMEAVSTTDNALQPSEPSPNAADSPSQAIEETTTAHVEAEASVSIAATVQEATMQPSYAANANVPDVPMNTTEATAEVVSSRVSSISLNASQIAPFVIGASISSPTVAMPYPYPVAGALPAGPSGPPVANGGGEMMEIARHLGLLIMGAKDTMPKPTPVLQTRNEKPQRAVTEDRSTSVTDSATSSQLLDRMDTLISILVSMENRHAHYLNRLARPQSSVASSRSLLVGARADPTTRPVGPMFSPESSINSSMMTLHETSQAFSTNFDASTGSTLQQGIKVVAPQKRNALPLVELMNSKGQYPTDKGLWFPGDWEEVEQASTTGEGIKRMCSLLDFYALNISSGDVETSASTQSTDQKAPSVDKNSHADPHTVKRTLATFLLGAS
ncbi:hypothetical protein M427DRAFT_29878 [Gonapodya prolifera JEL478]|uniref:Uncharacterized protein n=1 Tax=Gonapodya prolifera (strain JEL478) TaxID=1344416 RepID=A0A139ANQ6_GONPJ|nr:hypothetical protein M427DRAFT_29878 [Gonapodya prolifera JEL478]|eukprot:KXS18133.1 hypothetical protein M427DRAFT_29878 [Gonapodya prolifera JEL478]